MLPARLVLALLVAATATVSAVDAATGFNAVANASPGLVHGGDSREANTETPVASTTTNSPPSTPLPSVQDQPTPPQPTATTEAPAVPTLPPVTRNETEAPGAADVSPNLTIPPSPTPTTAPTNSSSTPTPTATNGTLPPATTPPRFPYECDEQKDTDIVGYDLTNLPGKSFKDCAVMCLATRGCKTYVWNDYKDGTCWLKTKVGRKVPMPGASTGLCPFVGLPVCTPYENLDFVGNDIGNKPAKTAGDCCDVCNEFKGCTAYAWNDYNGGTCWLKNGVGRVVARAGVTSASMVPMPSNQVPMLPKCSVEQDVDYVGNDIGNKPAADAGVCCSLCKEDPACGAYTWSDFKNGTCWMKSGKGKVVPAKGMASAVLLSFN